MNFRHDHVWKPFGLVWSKTDFDFCFKFWHFNDCCFGNGTELAHFIGRQIRIQKNFTSSSHFLFHFSVVAVFYWTFDWRQSCGCEHVRHGNAFTATADGFARVFQLGLLSSPEWPLDTHDTCISFEGMARLWITIICYLFPEWRAASLVCACVALPALLSIIFIFPESPTWLHSKVCFWKTLTNKNSEFDSILYQIFIYF